MNRRTLLGSIFVAIAAWCWPKQEKTFARTWKVKGTGLPKIGDPYPEPKWLIHLDGTREPICRTTQWW